MRTLELTANVDEDGILTVVLPPDIAPGAHRVVLVIEELRQTSSMSSASPSPDGDLGIDSRTGK